VPLQNTSLISYLPATSYSLRLRGVRFSYLSGLECTFAKDDASRQRALTTFRTADLLAGRRILSPTVPGVIVSGQISSAVARYILQRTMTVGMGILFILVAALMLGEVILNVR